MTIKYYPWRFAIGMSLLILSLVNVFVNPEFYTDPAGRIVLLMGLVPSCFFLAYSITNGG